MDSGSVSFHGPPYALFLIGWLGGRNCSFLIQMADVGARLDDRALGSSEEWLLQFLGYKEAGSVTFFYASAKQDVSRDLRDLRTVPSS